MVTDGRYSGATRGPCIGYVCPEAAAGGPIGAVEDGDLIEIDIPNRLLNLLIPEHELKKRLHKRVAQSQNSAPVSWNSIAAWYQAPTRVPC